MTVCAHITRGRIGLEANAFDCSTSGLGALLRSGSAVIDQGQPPALRVIGPMCAHVICPYRET